MNKIYNKHIEKILLESNKYRIIDLYICLSDLAQQIKVGKGRTDYRFIVMSNNSAYSIYEEIELKYPKFMNSTTCRSCLNELIELGIVVYNKELKGFEIVNMEKMLNKKDKGYMTIRDYFFTENFANMPVSEKKVLLYLLSLQDKKAVSNAFKNKYGVDVFINLDNFKKSIKKDKLNIMNILRTNNVYYAKEVLDNLINNNPDIIINRSIEKRKENYDKEKGRIRGLCIDMTYFFDLQITNGDIVEQEERLSNRFIHLSSMIDTLKEIIGVSVSADIKVFLMKKLYRYVPFVQKEIITTYLARVKDDLDLSKKHIKLRSAKAFIQHLINCKPQYKTAIANNNKYSKVVEDIVLGHRELVNTTKEIVLPF